MGETRTEWAVDYQDGTGPRPASDKWVAGIWVKHWNTHREDQEPARLMSRTVTTTAWEPVDETDVPPGDDQ
jgi:hypothetical protein